MFWEMFSRLCLACGTSPNAAAKKVGVRSSGTVSAWKNGAMPRDGVLMELASLLHVSVPFLCGLETDDPNIIDQTILLSSYKTRLENETDPKKREELRMTIDVLEESLSDTRLAEALSGTKKAPAESGEGDLDEFTFAAHEYGKILSQRDRKVIVSMMRQLAEDIERKNNGETG